MSNRVTYETSPRLHLTAVTDREFGVERCSQLLLARRADDVIPGEAQSSPISVEGIMTGVALFGRLTIVPSPS